MNTSYKVVRSAPGSGVLLAVAAAIVGLAISLPWWGESSWMREFVEIACYFIFAMMWNLLAGYGGQFSFGHAAFFGTGAYAMGLLQVRFGINPWAAMPVGALSVLSGAGWQAASAITATKGSVRRKAGVRGMGRPLGNRGRWRPGPPPGSGLLAFAPAAQVDRTDDQGHADRRADPQVGRGEGLPAAGQVDGVGQFVR